MEANERAENLERQAEEAEALSAIYGDEFSGRVGGGGLWEISVPFSGSGDADDDDGDHQHDADLDPTGAIFAATGRAPPTALAVRVVLLETYPSRTPPLVELDAALLPFGRYELAMSMVEEIYGDNQQQVMVFGYVEWLRGMLRQWREEDTAAAAAGGGDRGGGEHAAADVDDDEHEHEHEHVWDPVALEEELAGLALQQSSQTGDEEERRRRSTWGDASTASWSMEEEVAARIVHGRGLGGSTVGKGGGVMVHDRSLRLQLSTLRHATTTEPSPPPPPPPPKQTLAFSPSSTLSARSLTPVKSRR